MTTLNADDSYRLRRYFLSAFVADNNPMPETLHGNGTEVSGNRVKYFANRLLWECIDIEGWRKCTHFQARSLLENLPGEVFVLTDAINNKKVSADSPIFEARPDEVIEFLSSPGFWNFYVFDSTISWCIIFTDECETAYPEGICFANIC